MSHKTRRTLTIAMLLAFCLVITTVIFSVRAQEEPSGETVAEAEPARLVAEEAEWGDNVTLEFDGDKMFVKSDGLPDHEILDVYQALSIVDNKTIFLVEPLVQRMRVEVPLLPEMAEEPTPTGIGLIGIAISGGLFYSPYEADGTTVALDGNFTIDGIPFIDACNGHPNPLSVQYHYHGIPFCITEWLDEEGEHSRLLGYLLDGFPVYGPQDEDGEFIAQEDLDECHGHFGATPEFPDGVYHYHLLDVVPYSVPCYSGVVDISDDPMSLLTRGVDTSYPPVVPPLGVLLPGAPGQPTAAPTPSN